MTKKQLLFKIVSPMIVSGLSRAYQLNASALSEKQEKLVDLVCEDIYSKFEDKLSLKDLQEMYGETDV